MSKIVQDEVPELKLIDKKSIGDRVSEIRKHKGLTQQELADQIGIKRTLLSEYEIGRTRIHGEMIIKISIALQLSPEKILGFKNIHEEGKESYSLRYTKRIKEIEKLPEHKKRAILKNIDDSIKANKE